MASCRSVAEGFAPSAGGGRLYYRRVGTGPTTVVIPAAAWWGSQADTLATQRQVVLYDTRGRGRSDPIADTTPVGMDDAVADLDSLRAHLGLRRMSLIGWSYLGALVVLYAAAHSEAVDRIVQVGPLMPRKNPYWDQWMADYSARAARVASSGSGSAPPPNRVPADPQDPTAVRNGLLATVLPQLGDTSVADRIVDAVGTDLPNERPAALAKLLTRAVAALGEWDFGSKAGLVSAPVLTVHGSADNVPRSACLEWVRLLPNARLLQFAGIGHYPFFECPEAFFKAVEDFLNGRWPETARPAG